MAGPSLAPWLEGLLRPGPDAGLRLALAIALDPPPGSSRAAREPGFFARPLARPTLQAAPARSATEPPGPGLAGAAEPLP